MFAVSSIQVQLNMLVQRTCILVCPPWSVSDQRQGPLLLPDQNLQASDTPPLHAARPWLVIGVATGKHTCMAQETAHTCIHCKTGYNQCIALLAIRLALIATLTNTKTCCQDSWVVMDRYVNLSFDKHAIHLCLPVINTFADLMSL